MKVIFLDIDGVMNNNDFIVEIQQSKGFEEYIKRFDPANVRHLNHILSEVPDAKIVVSSTWRKTYPTDKGMKDLFKNNGIDETKVVGRTPFRLEDRFRGNEIQDWLNDHPEVESFVILDDDSDMLHLMPHLVRTNIDYGLTNKDAERAIKMLAKGR